MNDQKIDSLLASRPVKVPEDFSARVLAATEGSTPLAGKHPRSRRWTIALPAAAAVALLLTLAPRPSNQGSPTAQLPGPANPVLEEAILLDRGLSGLDDAFDDDAATFEVDGLLATFDALYLDLQS